MGGANPRPFFYWVRKKEYQYDHWEDKSKVVVIGLVLFQPIAISSGRQERRVGVR